MAKGLDCGTGNYVATTENGSKIQRNAFITIDTSMNTKKSLKRLGIPFIELNNELHIIGKAAYEYAQVFGNTELRRPMANGLLNPAEKDALPILKEIIKELLGEPSHENEIVVYCVPGKPIDKDTLVDYHEDVLGAIINSLGYKARAINEAEALAYSGLIDNNLTGITISSGAGMCLRGDTKIPLLNGETKTIKELSENHVDEKFWVYSSKEDGQVVPGLAWNPHKVKTTDKILRLWFDNNEYLDCTPDHLIMMRDGSFKEAQELEEGTSLMPLYLRGRKIDGRPGYIEVKNNKTNRFNSVHRLIYAQHAEVTLCKDDVIHHINFNPEDNTPENLQLTDRAEHQKIHDNLGKWMRDNLKDNTYEECFGKERAEEIKLKQSVSHKKSGPNAGTFKKGAVPHNKGKTLEEQYGLEKATELKEKISRKTKEAMRALEVREKYLATHHNHKVVKIEQLNIEEDVYDMTVDNYHNFAINSGVFVHNCNIGIFYGGMKALAFSVSRGGDFIDYHVSLDTGVSPAKAQYIKEDGNFDLSNPKLSVESGVAKIKESTLTREQNAIKTYYGVLIRYLLANIAKQFKNAKDMPAFPNPVPLVIGGGTAMVKGFIDLFKNEFEQKGFPINLSGIKIVDEPFTAVSRGCYADSALEEEE